ncbi:TPA: protein Eaa, partial [Salmonella enterica]|nr:protein Eaa [Salmonella enterica]
QPVPVVPDERAAFNAWNNEDNLPIAGVGAKNAAWLAWQARSSLCGNSALNVPPERPADSSNGDDIEAWFDEGWNACRAAMLSQRSQQEQR